VSWAEKLEVKHFMSGSTTLQHHGSGCACHVMMRCKLQVQVVVARRCWVCCPDWLIGPDGACRGPLIPPCMSLTTTHFQQRKRQGAQAQLLA
jgi:hypothetical protein